jgi:hypothetical protein
LLLRADDDQIIHAKELLDSFSRATGLQINFEKSAFVPIHVPDDHATMLASLIGCSAAAFPQTYLGLPLTARKLRVQDLQHLVVKVEKRALGWKSSLLNLGSRLTLTDAVLSALPTFAMSVIPMPVTTIDHMDRPRRGMLWKGKSACSGGDCQVTWHDVCRSRAEGGLGVRDLRSHNVSLLLKFIHKLVRGDDTPWTRWVRRWYGEGGISSPPLPTDTPAWRGFKRLFATYRGLTNVRVGDGATTSFWFDNWHAAGPLFSCLPALLTHCTAPALTVADALRHARLDLPLQDRLTITAQGQLAALEASLRHATLAEEQDSRMLPGGAKFTAAGVYRVMHSSGVAMPLADTNWVNFAPLKVRVFFWIARHGNTRTRALLHRHGCLPSPRCPFCTEDEDQLHLFSRCARLTPLFTAVGAPAAAVADDLEGVCAALAGALQPHASLVRNSLVLLLLWIIWKSRNRMVFDDVRMRTRCMVAMLVDHCELWLHRLPRRASRHSVDAWLLQLRENAL